MRCACRRCTSHAPCTRVSRHPPCTLLFDADDTLWENHAYFLQAYDEWLTLMTARGHQLEPVRTAFRIEEEQRTQRYGYGSRNFAESLCAASERLEGTLDPEIERRVRALGEWIHEHPIELKVGVRATLELLAPRHRMLLVTKGHPLEQQAKVARSGLGDMFPICEILREKNPANYAELVQRHGLTPAHTWMIGNSPKSDIIAAAAVGLRTVHIPHHTTWELEHREGPCQPDLLLTEFGALTVHF